MGCWSSFAIKIPKKTRAILFPTNTKAINPEGLLTKREIIFPERKPLFLSSSIRNLFDDTKAISIPEKKAENNSETIIITIYVTMFNYSLAWELIVSSLTIKLPLGLVIRHESKRSSDSNPSP